MEKKNDTLTQQEMALFDNIVKDLNTAIKNSVLYTSEHSICRVSITNLKSALDKWLDQSGAIFIGVTQDGLFCNNSKIDSRQERYGEVAGYLHLRGIVSMKFLQGITAQELTCFLNVVRKDSRAIQAEGGVLQKLPVSAHLEIKEIDYSALLGSAREEVVAEENQIWQALFDIADELKKGEIPESKKEFLVDFLKNSEKSAKVLNKIYNDAKEKMGSGRAAGEIQETIAKICAYFDQGPLTKKQDTKVDIMQILSRLHPDLVCQLFEKTTIGGEEFDMAESVTRGFSDGFIADFIESLISHEDSFNENMLKVFDKLAPTEDKANNVVSMVADKLLSKRILNPETLSKLQFSIKEIFACHPKSNFMSQMYKITVDAVANRKIDTLVYVARLAPAINKFTQSISENKLKKEEVELLLNILWLEEIPEDFKKFGMKLKEIIPELIDLKDMPRIREIMEFFAENLRPEQKESEDMSRSASEVVSEIATAGNIQGIIALIPGAKGDELNEIASIFVHTQAEAQTKTAGLLIDAFIAEKNPAYRNKYRVVLSKIKEGVVAEVMDRMDYSEPAIIRDLYHILKEYSPEKAHIVALKLIGNKNPQIRWEGLDGFSPENNEERESILAMFKKEKVPEIQKKAVEVLLRTDDGDILEKLFLTTRRSLFDRRKLLMLVEVCGQIKLQGAFPHLEKLFRKKEFLFRDKNDEVRMAVATSLARLHTVESLKVVAEGASDNREKVRKMCEILIKLDSQR